MRREAAVRRKLPEAERGTMQLRLQLGSMQGAIMTRHLLLFHLLRLEMVRFTAINRNGSPCTVMEMRLFVKDELERMDSRRRDNVPCRTVIHLISGAARRMESKNHRRIYGRWF